MRMSLLDLRILPFIWLLVSPWREWEVSCWDLLVELWSPLINWAPRKAEHRPSMPPWHKEQPCLIGRRFLVEVQPVKRSWFQQVFCEKSKEKVVAECFELEKKLAVFLLWTAFLEEMQEAGSMEQGGGAGRPHEVGAGGSERRPHPQLNFLVGLGLSQAGSHHVFWADHSQWVFGGCLWLLSALSGVRNLAAFFWR